MEAPLPLDTCMGVIYTFVIAFTIDCCYLLDRCSKEAEVYATIHALLYEMRVLSKVMIFAMFKDEESFRAKHAIFYDKVREFGQA